MQSIPHCSQYNPRAGKTDPCSDAVHQVSILWTQADGYRFNPTKPLDSGMVCDGHMQSFIELGQRDEFKYSIVEDEVIGEIAPQTIEGKPPTKEQK